MMARQFILCLSVLIALLLYLFFQIGLYITLQICLGVLFYINTGQLSVFKRMA